MNKKKIIVIISIVVLVLLVVVAGLYQTFALTSTITTSDDTYTITINSNSSITVPASSEKVIFYRITNPNDGKLKYGVAYTTGNVVVKIYDTSRDSETGLIDYGESKFIKLRLINESTTDSSVTISTILGYENGGALIVPSGSTLVSDVYSSTS